MPRLYEMLEKDVRYREGMKACLNCGVCTAICPAAEVSDYDPRQIMNIVQESDEAALEKLLKSDDIWRCGECLSCKTRCPRGNTPCYVIQALRALSIETGFFIESEQGRKQLAIKRTVGDHILQYGYCVYIDEVDNETYPEQGPVWKWIRKNRSHVMQRLGTSYGQSKAGTLRNTAKESLEDLKKIFDETGGTARFEKIEKFSAKKAGEMNKEFSKGKDEYWRYLYNE
ncbi:MAG TPA: 4Fe-4S dicluster domain-containing protein [Bacteroidales bacterium]|nr:4Fe-4S dicluster domain-containing protein [Bacteroidales bacterium]